jgi:hypothetical protein
MDMIIKPAIGETEADYASAELVIHVMLRGKFPIWKLNPRHTMRQLSGYLTPGDHFEVQIHSVCHMKDGTEYYNTPNHFHIQCPDHGPDVVTLDHCYDDLTILEFLMMFGCGPYEQPKVTGLWPEDLYLKSFPLPDDPTYMMIEVIDPKPPA